MCGSLSLAMGWDKALLKLSSHVRVHAVDGAWFTVSLAKGKFMMASDVKGGRGK